MKAVMVSAGSTKEAWGGLIGKFVGKREQTEEFSFGLAEIPEPNIPGPDWVRIRSIMSGISDFDEALFIDNDSSPFGSYVDFPFVPGAENLGIVTEIGSNVTGYELGERIVVNPLLSCEPRGMTVLCDSCRRGVPQYCSNFSKGTVAPGVFIGGCRTTSGGWADGFVAHKSMLRPLPPDMDSETAILAPEFSRALRAALMSKPGAEDKLVVIGCGSLGIMTIYALTKIYDNTRRIIAVADHAFEADIVRNLFQIPVILTSDRQYLYEELADILNSGFYLGPRGSTMNGGADIVYETSGLKQNIACAFDTTRERGTTFLMSPRQSSRINLTPVWLKGIHIEAPLFSALESDPFAGLQTIDVSMRMLVQDRQSLSGHVTHKYSLNDYGAAFRDIANKSSTKVVKAIFQHVM